MVASTRDDDLTALVEAEFAEADRFRITPSKWMVGRKGITSSWHVWLALKKDEEPGPLVLVVPLHAYYGRADASLWRWIEAKGGEDA